MRKTFVTVFLLALASYASAADVAKTADDAQKKDAPNCPKFEALLFYGSTDFETHGEVTRLQKWLKDYPRFYPSGEVNGMYTEDVELAVRKLQKKYEIVKPGLSCKTGYGIVEAKTRKYLNDNLSCGDVPARPHIICPAETCPALNATIMRGDADPDGKAGSVARLQCFLAQRSLLSPLLVTGAYGPSTERAVLMYQAQVGVSQTGVANLETRTAIARCSKGASGGAATATHTTESKSQRYSFAIRPASGPAPLTIALSFALNGSTCSSYQVDWGDGTAPLAYDAGRPSSCSPQPVTVYEKHTYTKAGVYNVTIKHGIDTLSRIPTVNEAQVTAR